MAATRGQQTPDRCQRDAMWHHFLRRPDREVGAKMRESAVELATRALAY
jgi:hypothetical protein